MIRPSHAPPRGRTAPLRQSGQRLGAAYGQVRCADSLAVFAEVPVGEGRAEAPASLGLIAQAQGGRDEARALFAESVMRAVEAGAHWLIAPGLEGLAEVAAAQGQHERAVRLLGAAEALRARVGVPRPPARRV